jgi:hypothetical protein
MVDLIGHAKRLCGGLEGKSDRSIPISLSEAAQAFERLIDQAVEQGRVALLADGNLPCEDLVAIHRWAESKDDRVSMAIYLPPTDFDLLEGLSAVEAPTLALEELGSYDGVIVIGNVFHTHPVLGRSLLDKKYENPRALFAVMDTLRSVTTRFSMISVEIAPETHQAVLEMLLAALEVSTTPDESPELARMAKAAGVSCGTMTRLVALLRAANKVAVIVSPELTKNSDWRSVAMLAAGLAKAKNGGVLPLLSYGNAVGAYRILRNLALSRFEDLLIAAKSGPWAAWVQVACDPRATYPGEMLECLFRPSTRRVAFSSLKTREVEEADLAISVPMPVEYSGTIVPDGKNEKKLTPMGRAPGWTQSAGTFFQLLIGQEGGAVDESVWKKVPVAVRKSPGPSRKTTEAARGQARLQAVTTPIHFDDGILTRATGWTAYWQAEPVVSISSALAEQLGVRSGGKVVLKRDGKTLEVTCRVESSLDREQATIPLHFPEVRRFLPWSLDESGARLWCPAPYVGVEPQSDGGKA